MVALEELHTNGNVGMSGNIPKSISKLEKLRYLNVADNGLRGTIPPGFSKLSNLEYALLFDNELSGEIPSLQAFTKLRECTYMIYCLLFWINTVERERLIPIAVLFHRFLCG